MPSRREQGRKGQGGSRRVYFTDEENEATAYHGSPAVNNADINSAHGSPSRSASSSTSHSRQSHHSQQSHHSHASPQNNRLGTPGPSTPVPTTGQAATPTPGAPGIATTTGPDGNPIIMTQQTFPGPSMPPMPICPPDPLGPPPPPPPPQAILPVVNPMGVHFQPQVPATDQGPMIHRYIPRFDPPCASYPAPQMGSYMATGTTMPMQPMQPISVAPMTAPINPVVVSQQPVTQPMMVQNPALPPGVGVTVAGSQPLMLQGATVTGNPPAPFGPQLPAQPPVQVEPALGVGLTPNETMAQNIRIAQNNKCYEPQDFRPADPDPYRMYWIRELNGHWAVFARREIDRLDVRWFRTDEGVFYAVRLSD